MKRFVALAACLAVCCALTGCEEGNKVEREIKIETPRGTTTIETEKKIEDPQP